MEISSDILAKARRIKWVITDCDGVLTDTGVYYTDEGEFMKRYSIRDGMGVERLRNIGVQTAIMTGEQSKPLAHRAAKLQITELYMYIKDKPKCLAEFRAKHHVENDEIAYIGDDLNDFDVLKQVGLSACPQDALTQIKESCDYICTAKGGHGAFRDLAELIIRCRI